MSEQRTDGVGDNPTAGDGELAKPPTAAAPGVGQETQEPTAGGAEPQLEPKKTVNLDDIEEYRKWKSAYDRRIGEVQKAAREAEERAAKLESELEELRMRDMPLDEREAFYRTKLAEERATRERQQEQTAQRQQYVERAVSALNKLGIDPQTPGLEWGDGPSAENYARLMESAARIVAEQTVEHARKAQEDAEEEARQARIGALNEAGVTRTSVATSGAPPETNPLKDIRDPAELLRMGTKARVADRQGKQPPRG